MSRPFANESAFRAIADPTRRRVLDLLRQRDRTVGDISQAFQLHPATVSQHLAILRTAGMITQQRRGRHRMYSLSAGRLRAVAQWLKPFERFWTP